MSRLTIPPLDEAPGASKAALAKVFGVVRNLFLPIGISSAAIEGFTALSGSVRKALDVKTRERIALEVGNTFTNLLNIVAQTEIDCPMARAAKAT